GGERDGRPGTGGAPGVGVAFAMNGQGCPAPRPSCAAAAHASWRNVCVSRGSEAPSAADSERAAVTASDHSGGPAAPGTLRCQSAGMFTTGLVPGAVPELPAFDDVAPRR